MFSFDLYYDARKHKIKISHRLCHISGLYINIGSCLVNTFFYNYSQYVAVFLELQFLSCVQGGLQSDDEKRQPCPPKLNLTLDVCSSLANTTDRMCTEIENTNLPDGLKGFVWLSPGFKTNCVGTVLGRQILTEWPLACRKSAVCRVSFRTYVQLVRVGVFNYPNVRYLRTFRAKALNSWDRNSKNSNNYLAWPWRWNCIRHFLEGVFWAREWGEGGVWGAAYLRNVGNYLLKDMVGYFKIGVRHLSVRITGIHEKSKWGFPNSFTSRIRIRPHNANV